MDQGIRVVIGPGEFIDRLTILRLKQRHAEVPELRAAVDQRVDEHMKQRSEMPDTEALAELEAALAAINAELWEAENAVRRSRNDTTSPAFLAAARQIPVLNDERASLKARIDALFGWGTTETKCYSE